MPVILLALPDIRFLPVAPDPRWRTDRFVAHCPVCGYRVSGRSDVAINLARLDHYDYRDTLDVSH